MRSGISILKPSTDEEWCDLPRLLNGGVENPLLSNIVHRLKRAGAVSIVVEQMYIDRDFSAAYSAFYATLFRPYRKQCARAHFFSCDHSGISATRDPIEIMAKIEAASQSYLGDIVLRPLQHAPVSSAHLAVSALAGADTQEVSVRSTFKVHLLGVELTVEAMPLTQQDTRTGACAQATMWMSGRHFHNRHGAAWFSMPDITAIALNPTDSGITRSLPAGSDFLTQDNMVRALRAMGRHPVMYAPDLIEGALVWQSVKPRDIVSRYVDSGIPVILGLKQPENQMGHGVVAVGVERDANKDASTISTNSTTAEFASHFLVNDDQGGPYCRLPLNLAEVTDEYPWCFDRDIKFVLAPLPEKVFMTAEIAEMIAIDLVGQVGTNRQALAAEALGEVGKWDIDPNFYSQLAGQKILTRTYLTYGWKYKARTLRNCGPARLKNELMFTEFPRYVWVTEFSEPKQSASLNPCERMIRAHSVVDATGSRFWESALLIDAPGLSVFWHCDAEKPSTPASLVIRADGDHEPYWPKVRGSPDFALCAELPEATPVKPDKPSSRA